MNANSFRTSPKDHLMLGDSLTDVMAGTGSTVLLKLRMEQV